MSSREHIAALALAMCNIEGSVLGAREMNGLCRKLIVGTRSLKAGDYQAAASQIRAFTLEVETLMLAGRMSHEYADPMLQQASTLVAKLAAD